MTIRDLYFCIAVAFILIGCKTTALEADLKKAETEIPKFSTPESFEKTNEKITPTNLKSSINQLSENEKDLLVKKLQLKDDKKLSDVYTLGYIDSLKAILNEKKKLKIDIAESFLLDFLSNKGSADTTIVSYLNIKSPTKGEVATYTYDMLAGDEVVYEITNGKHQLESIEFLEGETTRLKLNDIPKRKVVQGSFKMLSDNKLILNISNQGFLRNKGIIGSQIKIILKKIVPNKGTSTDIVNDTTYVNKSVNKTTLDTIYKVEDTKKIKLEPTINITKKNSFSFPIVITSTDSLIGWGYWIGATVKDYEIYESLQDGDQEAIISYAKQELKGTKPVLPLPKYQGSDLDILILNQSLDTRSINFDTNFAFYKTDHLIPRSSKKAEVRITNRSTIYDYMINYRLVTASIVKQTKMIETKVPVITKSIVIQLPEND